MTEDAAGMSRRSMLRKTAVAGAAVWAAPVLVSSPAHAAGSNAALLACFKLYCTENWVNQVWGGGVPDWWQTDPKPPIQVYRGSVEGWSDALMTGDIVEICHEKANTGDSGFGVLLIRPVPSGAGSSAAPSGAGEPVDPTDGTGGTDGTDNEVADGESPTTTEPPPPEEEETEIAPPTTASAEPAPETTDAPVVQGQTSVSESTLPPTESGPEEPVSVSVDFSTLGEGDRVGPFLVVDVVEEL